MLLLLLFTYKDANHTEAAVNVSKCTLHGLQNCPNNADLINKKILEKSFY